MVKNKTTSKQSIAIIVLSVLLVALLAVNITFAYFTAQDGTTTNQTITFDTLTLDVTDGTWSMASSDNETLTTVVPGCTINMDGKVTLAGADAYLKVVFNVTATNATSGTLNTDVFTTALGDALTGQGTWAKGTDNAWYCTSVKTEGDVIDFSSKSVTIPLATTGNDWQGATVTIGYTVTAVQADHVTAPTDAASAKALFDGINFTTGEANS